MASGDEDDEDNGDKVSRPRPFWSGIITFGLVTLPVSLFPANRGKQWALKMIDKKGVPLKRVYFCEKDGEALSKNDIVRGYEVDKDEYLVVKDEELRALAPEKSEEIDLRQFVRLEQVDPIFFSRAYFLVPDGRSTKAYRLLAKCMEEEGRAGIATFVMRDREYLVAIVSEQGILKAEMLRFSDEVRTPAEVGLTDLRPGDKEVVRAICDTIQTTSRKQLSTADLEDRYAERLEQLVAQKSRRGRDLVKVDKKTERKSKKKEDGNNVIDLMEVLRERMKGGRPQSIKGVKHEKVGQAKEKAKKSQSKESLPKKSRTSSSKKSPSNKQLTENLEVLSRKELYQRAQKKGIKGRSGMNKTQLIQTLSEYQG